MIIDRTQRLLAERGRCPKPDDAGAHIPAVTAALATFSEAVRNAIDETTAFGDADTSDVFTEIPRGVDQQLWLVESHREP